ncbi:MAG TPA: site-2 protease family protein [Thermoleophilaceae bacterium]|nr:site-2 protease family protein [Thermoleophilaceae bacterium]
MSGEQAARETLLPYSITRQELDLRERHRNRRLQGAEAHSATISYTMLSGRSIQLVRVLGIRIGVDASWFFVLFLIIWSLSGYYNDLFPGDDTKAFTLAVVSALLFFLSILLHELGHAVVAIRNGIGISGIDLWMFGGVAKMQRDTDTPGVEFRVAVAGPVVTLLIALICFGIGSAISSPDQVGHAARFRIGDFGGALAVLGYLAGINALVLVFNLIPGFPLDGGRIARAIAWWRTGDRTRATRFAARLGRGFAIAMIALGAFWFLTGDVIGGVWLVFIGFFLSQAARSAELQTVITSRIEGVRVRDVMDAEPVAVPDDMPLDRALDEYFLRYGWPWFPVVDSLGRFVGLVTRQSVEGVPETVRPGRTVASVMARDEAGELAAGLEQPLEALLGLDALQRLGAVMAVDADGVLRGIVTIDTVRRALQEPAAAV